MRPRGTASALSPPHPDDVALNYKRGTVTFNGPISHDEKAQWDSMFEVRNNSLEDIREGERLLRQRPGKLREVYETEIANLRKLADIVGGVFPDEKTRRTPGFDLEAWRDRNGTLERLKREQRARQRKRQPKKSAASHL